MNKNTCCCDPANARMQEMKDEIKTIGTRATWLLGILVITIFALANFLFQDLNEYLIMFSPAWWAKLVIAFFFIYYLTITAVYMRPLIVSNFKKPTYETNEEELKKILNGLNSNLKALSSLFIIPLPFIYIFGLYLTFWLLY